MRGVTGQALLTRPSWSRCKRLKAEDLPPSGTKAEIAEPNMASARANICARTASCTLAIVTTLVRRKLSANGRAHKPRISGGQCPQRDCALSSPPRAPVGKTTPMPPASRPRVRASRPCSSGCHDRLSHRRAWPRRGVCPTMRANQPMPRDRCAVWPRCGSWLAIRLRGSPKRPANQAAIDCGARAAVMNSPLACGCACGRITSGKVIGSEVMRM